MSNYELFQHLVGEEIKKSCPESRLLVVGDLDAFNKDDWLFYVAGELVSNCAEKGAEEITITLSPQSMIVEDNLVHPVDVAEKILENVRQSLPSTSKNDGENGQTKHGFGIFSVRRTLSETGGSLNYEHRNGRIIALVSL